MSKYVQRGSSFFASQNQGVNLSQKDANDHLEASARTLTLLLFLASYNARFLRLKARFFTFPLDNCYSSNRSFAPLDDQQYFSSDLSGSNHHKFATGTLSLFHRYHYSEYENG